MSDNEEVIKELRVTNRLLAHMLIKDASNQTQRVVMLERSGFSTSDIADLLNIKNNIVRATLSMAKKSETKKQKSKAKQVTKSNDK